MPSAYHFRVFGVTLSNKSYSYVLASQVSFKYSIRPCSDAIRLIQLAIGNLPGSAVAAAIGILTGQIYRSDLTNLKSYRIPPWFVNFSRRFLLPLVGSMRPPRRLNRALPDEQRANTGQGQNEEVITTARPPSTGTGVSPTPRETGTSVMREWVNELTGRESAGIRVPSEAEIAQITSMFPDVQRQTVIGALQRR